MPKSQSDRKPKAATSSATRAVVEQDKSGAITFSWVRDVPQPDDGTSPKQTGEMETLLLRIRANNSQLFCAVVALNETAERLLGPLAPSVDARPDREARAGHVELLGEEMDTFARLLDRLAAVNGRLATL